MSWPGQLYGNYPFPGRHLPRIFWIQSGLLRGDVACGVSFRLHPRCGCHGLSCPSTLLPPWAVILLGEWRCSACLLSRRSCLVCHLRCAPACLRPRLRWRALAYLLGPPSTPHVVAPSAVRFYFAPAQLPLPAPVLRVSTLVRKSECMTLMHGIQQRNVRVRACA